MDFIEYSDRFKKIIRSIFLTIVQKGNKAFEQGRDVINLGEGNPDQSMPPHIITGKK